MNEKWWKKGFTLILNRALFEFELTKTEIIILSYLGYRSANGKRKVKITNAEIAEECDCSKISVERSLRKLENHKHWQKGLISLEFIEIERLEEGGFLVVFLLFEQWMFEQARRRDRLSSDQGFSGFWYRFGNKALFSTHRKV